MAALEGSESTGTAGRGTAGTLSRAEIQRSFRERQKVQIQNNRGSLFIVILIAPSPPSTGEAGRPIDQ
jgi:hypothetical protein